MGCASSRESTKSDERSKSKGQCKLSRRRRSNAKEKTKNENNRKKGKNPKDSKAKLTRSKSPRKKIVSLEVEPSGASLSDKVFFVTERSSTASTKSQKSKFPKMSKRSMGKGHSETKINGKSTSALVPSTNSVKTLESKTSRTSKRSVDEHHSGASVTGKATSASVPSTNTSKSSQSKSSQRSKRSIDESHSDHHKVNGKSSCTSVSSTRSVKSLKLKTSGTSEGSKCEGHAKVKVNGKSSRDHRPVELRPTRSGCSGKCSQTRQESQLLSNSPNERLSNKCQRPSSVKIEFCEICPRLKRSKEIIDEEVNKISQFFEEIFDDIKKKCKRLKVGVMQVVKKKSTTALNKMKESYDNLNDDKFLPGQKNCDLDDCGTGKEDCTSKSSSASQNFSGSCFFSSTEQLPMSKEILKKKTKKQSQKVFKSKNDLYDKMQICECEDNPNKGLKNGSYTICCCTSEDSHGNKIKKGCC